MGFTETILFYLFFGATVATSLYLSGRTANRKTQHLLLLSAVCFWPFDLPLLLTRRVDADAHDDPLEHREATDVMQSMIVQVEGELDQGLRGLGGWAEDALAHEKDRLAELRSAWPAQASRIREIDTVLAEDFESPQECHDEASRQDPAARATAKYETSRQRNLEKLENFALRPLTT